MLYMVVCDLVIKKAIRLVVLQNEVLKAFC